MKGPLHDAHQHHGLGDPGLSRYAVLLTGYALWLVLGALLYIDAAWPSTCRPAGLIEIYACSGRLPESGRWWDIALLTWLWSTPILVLLGLGQRLKPREKEIKP